MTEKLIAEWDYDRSTYEHLGELKKGMSIARALDYSAQNFGSRNFIYSPSVNGYKGYSFEQFQSDIHCLAAYLFSQGLKDANIFLLGENSYEWMVADLAIMGYVGTCVAVNREWPASDIVEAVRFTGARALICSRACKELAAALEGIIPIWVLEDDLPGLIVEGGRLLAEQSDILQQRDISAPAKIIFSSGTTGIPKAAMLSQVNLFFGLDNLYRRAPMGVHDRCYLLVPLHHTYGGIYNFLYPLLLGMEIYLSSGSKQMSAEMQAVKPTVFSGVPRIFTAILTQIREAMGNSSDEVIGAALRQVFGGEMKYLFCGGSPIDSQMQQAYKQSGLMVRDAYGLTETGSSFAFEYVDDIGFGSVGKLFEDIEVRIDNPNADGWGEVLVKGNNVFLGYFQNPDANAQAFTEDGYFRSGDIGRFDDKRRLYLDGRCRPMFKTSRGERVYPQDVAAKLLVDERVLAAKVYCLNGEVAARLFTDLSAEQCEALIDDANANLPRYAKIVHFDIRPAANHFAWK